MKADGIFWWAVALASAVGGFLWDHQLGIAILVALLPLWSIALSLGLIAEALSDIYELQSRLTEPEQNEDDDEFRE